MTQAIPMDTMSVFKLQSTWYDKTTSMVQNFWQGQKNEKIKTKWLRWNNVCTPEEESDLCICDFEVFNLALLAKRGRLILYA